MIIFGLDKFGFSIDFNEGNVLISLGWLVIVWFTAEIAKKVIRVAHLNEDVRNDYNQISKIKSSEYRRGIEEGRKRVEDRSDYWHEAFSKEFEKSRKYSKELQELKPKLEYLESLVKDSAKNSL